MQQSIPIDRIYEDGTWRCGNVYSQMWSMPDINFTMSDEDNKAKILDLLGKVYMGVPSDCWLKICIVSQRMDEKSFRENVLLHRNLDGLDKWRVERNRRIRQCVQDAGNVVQHKYLILSTNKQNVTDSSWKRFRKYNAYATGISQDIQDYLDNPVAYALLSNSEFVIMLRQSKSLEALERLYGLSKPQLEFLRNASEGHGIIKMGNSMIPFSNLEPKDTAVYKLITTKPGEATAEK